MSIPKRPPRKSAAPAALTVPRLRTMRSDDDLAAHHASPATRPAAKRPIAARRARRPKFVF